MIKERFDVIASSMGSYFGVGFNTPEQQLAYDLGYDENLFTEEAEDRMSLGTELEDGVLNYFEKKLGIIITDRNEQMIYAFDGKLKGKVDGLTLINDEPCGVECKVSNAQSKFTSNKGYYLQCQCYMAATGYKRWLLCGLYNGKPIFEWIERDDRVIGLIEQVVDFLYDVFIGVADEKDFPYHVTSQFNETPELAPVEFDADDVALIEELYEKKQQVKDIAGRIDELEKYFKTNFENVKYEGSTFTATITKSKSADTFDLSAYKIDHPDFDDKPYKKPGTEYTRINYSKKKPK